MKKTIITLCFLVCILSCYKDKGNYTYKGLDKISGETDRRDNVAIGQNETFELKPKLEFKNKTDKADNYTYRWVLSTYKGVKLVSEKTISEKKDLHFSFKNEKNLKGKGFKLLFLATNKKTGIVYLNNYDVEITLNYRKGLLILHENNEAENKLDLSFLILKKELDRESEHFIDGIKKKIYKKVTHKDLLKEGKYQAAMLYAYSNIYILTNNYSNDYGVVLDSKTLNYKSSIKDCIYEDLPEDLHFTLSTNSGAHLILNNELYAVDRSKKGSLLEYGLPEIENKNIDYFNNCISPPMFHATDGRAYQYLAVSNKIVSIVNFLKPNQKKEDFLMKGQCLFLFNAYQIDTSTGEDPDGEDWDSDQSSLEATVYYSFFLIRNQDKVYFYKLTTEVESTNYEDKLKNVGINTYLLTPALAEIITKKSYFVYDEAQEIVYIAHKNIIYKWNYDNYTDESFEEWHRFDDNIEITHVSLAKLNSMDNQSQFVVCTYDKSKQNNDGASIYLIDEDAKIIDTQKNCCGKIKSIVVLGEALI
jgi:hypothetical protein